MIQPPQPTEEQLQQSAEQERQQQEYNEAMKAYYEELEVKIDFMKKQNNKAESWVDTICIISAFLGIIGAIGGFMDRQPLLMASGVILFAMSMVFMYVSRGIFIGNQIKIEQLKLKLYK